MADKIVVLATDQITLWCYPDKSMIHHVMHKPIVGAPLQAALKAGSDALRANKATKWLSDDRNNGPLTSEDMTFLPEVWFPETQKAGWKFWAIVMPERVISQLNMKRVAKMYSDRGVLTEMFSDPDDAMTWLTAQK